MKYIINCFIVCLVDLFSKRYINKKYKLSKQNEIYPDKLYIWNTKNKGIAYNKLEQSPNMVKFITGAITALLGVVFACTVFKSNTSKLFKLGISTALGGALGNLIDRMKNGCVTDFIYIKSKKIKNMPIFNIADVGIFLGSICMFLTEFFKK